MEKFVLEVSAKVNIDKGIAGRAVGALLVYVMLWTAADDWSELVSKLPKAGTSLSAASMSLAVAYDDRMIAMEGIINPLRRSGLSRRQIPAVVGLFLDYVKSNAGDTLAERVVAATPSLTTIAFLDIGDTARRASKYPEPTFGLPRNAPLVDGAVTA